jgi:hypothetical protein
MTLNFRANPTRLALVTVASIAFAASTLGPSSAGLRDRMKTKAVDGAASDMVNTIQSSSCPQFAMMMASHKSGDSSQSSKLKDDPATRQQFVDKVAGPLLYKMIDCDLLPSK